MTDDRRRTSRPGGSLWLLALILTVTALIGVNQWRLSAEVSRLEGLVRESHARQESAIYNVLARQQELAAEIKDEAETARLKDLAYFPPGAFGKDDDRAAAVAGVLRGLKAESLWALAERKDAGPSVRLLWLPDTGRPTAVRLLPPDRSNTWSRLEVAQRAGPDPDGTGKLVLGRVGLLPEHAASLNRRLDLTGLWSAPASPAGGHPDDFGAKGGWVLEGVKDGRYHLMVGGPASDPAFRNFSWEMLDYSRRTSARDLLIP